MNTLYKKLMVAVVLVVSLASCKENGLVAPDKSDVASAGAVNDLIPVGVPKKYTLIKHGQVTLTYMADGRLQKATYGPGPISYPYTSVTYAYGIQSIKTTAYSGRTVVLEETYQLDATGRCTESKEKTFVFYSFGTVELVQPWVYQYNALGQLKTRTSQNNGEKTTYTFNADGDLTKASSTGIDGNPYKDITFAYDQPTGDPILTDRNLLNSERTFLPDPYLRIFGKSSKHLAKLITEKNFYGNQAPLSYYYSYTLNADGYITEEKTFNVFNAALISTKNYDYLVTNIGFQ
ncbi:DUF4595 domain-containing protein [Spirosoma sp. HMF4905]|uniref:DUF4595 domain-containing protein n=1 Tax=Spirosoma arboris TaxID=2682092 RepID=A0A7K1SDZ1_9BACT|nr:DUF4595 domain-containing protein [Spirosoma arboris]MVM32001.1 DUF4595 domain-containing protein [Spirosoma arboris]